MVQHVETVGNTNVPLELWVYDLNGQGVTGLAPVVAIRRVVDGLYLDFNDNIFKSSGWTTRQAVMSEVNSTLSAGAYHKSWNSSLSVSADGEYAAEYDTLVVGYAKDVDYISFMLKEVNLAMKVLINKRKIDKTLPVPTEVLYDDNGTTVLKSWELTHTATEDTRLPV